MARLQLQVLTPDQKRAVIRAELKRTALALLTNQNFSGFNATKLDSLGLPYPDAGATVALSAYIRFFEQAVEWDHLECAFLPYFWGSRSSWVSKLLGVERDPQFAAFLGSGAARVVLPIRPGYEAAFEKFLNTGKTPTTDRVARRRRAAVGVPDDPAAASRRWRTTRKPRSATRGSSGSRPISCAPAVTTCCRSGR